MTYEEAIKRKDLEIEELKEKNETLLGAMFKKEKENAELKRIIKRLERV